jgi:uncharacterized membrane protein
VPIPNGALQRNLVANMESDVGVLAVFFAQFFCNKVLQRLTQESRFDHREYGQIITNLLFMLAISPQYQDCGIKQFWAK